MLQNPCKTFGFMKNMVYKIPPGGGGGGGGRLTISSQWIFDQMLYNKALDLHYLSVYHTFS